MLYADHRWIGDHGIGRFARQVLAHLEYRPVPLTTNPASPIDAWRLSRALGAMTDRDLFFSPGYNPPLYCKGPFVFTLHDLNHIDRSENSNLAKRIYYATLLKNRCHAAARIFTVSEYSRTRILDWSGVDADKVISLGNGVGPEYHPGVKPYDYPSPYILCVSNRKKHKNEFRSVEAFAQSGISSRFVLVFTGKSTEELAQCIESNHVTQRVHFLGFVPEADLPSLYRGATALVFASLYEGFGLPPLEAMACGTPVVTSNVSSLPEVAGDAALLVDPSSVAQIAEALKRIVEDQPLRQDLAEKGIAQARKYRWDDIATRTREILDGLQREL